MPHIPVLYQEALAGLQVKPGRQYIDATLGAGGHAAGILSTSAPDGQLLGIDTDPAALAAAGERLAEDSQRAILVRGNFADLTEIAIQHGFHPVDGILFDLGLSSLQLEVAERGFSFQRDGPLDMRFNPALETTAADLVNHLSEAELADLLFRYGEEPMGRRIARAIVRARPIQTTMRLAEVVKRATGPSKGRRRRRIHPATRTFQALRMVVNDELPALETALSQALGLLAPDGRLLVISFHSLEDRVVKTFFRQESRDCICPPELPTCLCRHRARLEILTKKPIRPSDREIEANRRSRSAKLRIARRL